MSKVNIRVDEEKFEKGWDKAITEIALNLTQELAAAAPVDTGYLKTNMRYEIENSVINIRMPDYAMYVEFGTPPHVIEAKNAKFLHFKSEKIAKALGFPSDDVFLKKVNHSGTAPNPFIRRTLDTKLKEIINTALVRNLR